MRILIVDDSAVVRQIFTGVFKRLKIHNLDHAENGRLAVSMAEEHNYDLILLDWNMPEMLGIDALKAIRATGNEVPIIMVTTESEKPNIVRAIEAGATSYILKPFTSTILLEKISHVLPDLLK